MKSRKELEDLARLQRLDEEEMEEKRKNLYVSESSYSEELTIEDKVNLLMKVFEYEIENFLKNEFED